MNQNYLPNPLRSPNISIDFNKDKIIYLVDNLETEDNLSILKTGYFIRRKNDSCTSEECFSILLKALASKPEGSHAWYRLQSLIGFGGTHTGEKYYSLGVKAYQNLFKKALQVNSHDSEKILQRSIYEFVVLASGNSAGNLSNECDIAKIFEDVVNAYLILIRQNVDFFYQVPWEKALENLSLPNEKIISAVEKSLHDPLVPKTPTFYIFAVSILGINQPEKAIQILRQNRNIFTNDPEITKFYYDLLVGMQKRSDDFEGAIVTQLEKVKSLKFGRSDLLELYHITGNNIKMKAMLTDLQQHNIPEQELLECLAVWQMIFLTISPITKNTYDIVPILMSYLERVDKTNNAELQIRLLLYSELIKERKDVEAKKVISEALLIETNDRLGSILQRQCKRQVENFGENGILV
jgi:hypothetical protein